jgi:hypothetical protein
MAAHFSFLPLIVLGVMVFIFLKIMDYLKLRATVAGDGMGESGRGLEEIQMRLDEIERRMTDVQDVMIALSEKFDRWEREKASL